MTPNEIMTSTIKPAPPPKPSHLSSAFTGTLDSDALRSYIRQQSIKTITNKHQQNVHNDISTIKVGLSQIISRRVSIHEEEEEEEEEQKQDDEQEQKQDDDDEDEDDEGGTIWGTARQRQQTPTKPRYGKLASLFSPYDALVFGSQSTIKPKDSVHPIRETSEESSNNVATIKVNKTEKESRSISPVLRHARGTIDQTSYSSSSMGTERSRQPSVLSRLSAFSDDDDDIDEHFRTAMQQETPKKKWMHIRDGSAFERAGPKSIKERTPSKVRSSTSGNSVGDLTDLVAGPTPLRPCSLSIDTPIRVDDEQDQLSQNPLLRSAENGKAARALYSFKGEVSFNELSLVSGQSFEILNEDVGGGWSLATAREGLSERRGLVPRGWYTYVQDFARLLDLPAYEEKRSESECDPSKLSFDQQSQDMTASPSPFLSGLSPSSHRISHRYSGRSVVIPKDDRSRPASGIGQMYSESGTAIQALTHMQRSSSTPSYIASKSGTKPLRSAIKECKFEEGSLSKSSIESDALHVSTSATSVTEEAEANQSSLKSPSVFTSPWKTPALFGGRSLNRFVPFVTSGAEEYVLFGKAHEAAEDDGNDRFKVVSGHDGYPSWKHPGLVVVTEVHSPEVHTDESGREYTAYVVYSSYVLSSEEEVDWANSIMQDPHVRPQEAALTSSVYRRFNQFRWLSSYLGKLFPSLMLSMPPFPSTSYGARFDPLFVQRRRRQLQTWLLQVVRHPVFSNEDAVRFFLDSEEDLKEWNLSAQKIQQHEADSRRASVMLFSKTFYPLFNVDVCESEVETTNMNAFCDAYQNGLVTPDTGMLASFKAIRQSAAGNSDSYRQMSYSLLRLITGSPQVIAKSSVNGTAPIMQLDSHVTLPPMGNVGRRDANGATNEERAWCWREGCKECKRMTRSLQGTAEALQSVADSFEDHSNGGLFELHDRLATLAKLNSQHTSLMETHKAVLLKYRQATGEGDSSYTEDDGSRPVDAAMEQMASRCEGVVNVLMSEMDRIHTERCQDWNSLHNNLLNMQIEFYEDILSTLRDAKSQCNSSHLQEQEETTIANEGPILPSPYESHLSTPHHILTLLQPDLSHSSNSYFNIWK